MGTYSTIGASRKDIIDQIVSENETVAKTVRGNILWAVMVGNGEWYICCFLLRKCGDDWGYKPIEEEMGPCYYNCPLKYLNTVTKYTNEEWREGVRSYHAKKKVEREEYKKRGLVKRGRYLYATTTKRS